MESMRWTDDLGHIYEVITKRSSGHWIMIQLDSSVSPWVLRYPDGEMVFFKTEYDLWKFALIERKLF